MSIPRQDATPERSAVRIGGKSWVSRGRLALLPKVAVSATSSGR